MSINYQDFERVDIRSGTVVKVEDFPRPKKSAYKVWFDFGPLLGILKSSARVTVLYTKEELIGRSLLA